MKPKPVAGNRRHRQPQASNHEPRRADRWGRVTQWISVNTVAALTVGGLLLYLLLNVPYFVYFGHLGVTLDEVGLTYTQILSGSVSSLLLLTLLLAFIGLIIASVWAFFALAYSSGRGMIWFLNLRIKAQTKELDFEVVENQSRAYITSLAPDLLPVVERLQKTWEGRRANLQTTDADSYEQPKLEFFRILMPIYFAIGKQLARRTIRAAPRVIPVLVLLSLLFGLPMLAYVQADSLSRCGNSVLPSVGISTPNQSVFLAGPAVSELGLLEEQAYLLLGSTAHTYVVYHCSEGETVRIPRRDDLLVVSR